MSKKRGQEEMVGFAIIIVLVAVVLLVFLGISLNKKTSNEVESFEIQNFLSASLYYTTSCETNLEFLSLQELIFYCDDRRTCLKGEAPCEMLEDIYVSMIGEAWPIENRPIKGYSFNITKEGSAVIPVISEGNRTGSVKASRVGFRQGSQDFDIVFSAYY